MVGHPFFFKIYFFFFKFLIDLLIKGKSYIKMKIYLITFIDLKINKKMHNSLHVKFMQKNIISKRNL